MFTGRKGIVAMMMGLAIALSGCGVAHVPKRTGADTVVHGSVDLTALAKRFAPWLRLNASEPYRVEEVVAVFHPERSLIGYHVFFTSDVVRPHAGTRYDHEIVWVTYDPVTLKIIDAHTYWHRTVLRTNACVLEAQRSSQRPIIDVQWGQHGMLPFGWQSLRTTRPFVELKVHYNLVRYAAVDRFPNDVEPLAFPGTYDDYVRFTGLVDLAALIHHDGVAVAISPKLAFRDLLADEFAEKKNWPYQ